MLDNAKYGQRRFRNMDISHDAFFFYTFQALSYVIDVCRGKEQVQKSIPDVGLHITFSPADCRAFEKSFAGESPLPKFRLKEVRGERAVTLGWMGLWRLCFKFIMTFPDARIWQSDRERCLDFSFRRILTIRTR